MKRFFPALLALPLLAAPAAAQCGHGGTLNFGFGFGAKVSLSGHAFANCGPAPCGPGGGGGSGLGPWYLYWPLEAHFQTPAPTGYPYWPAPQTLPDGTGTVPSTHGYHFQPAAYAPGTPSYWYGR